MGQAFKNRDEKAEFIRAMTSPVSGSDWNIALSFDGPIRREFLAVQDEMIAEHIAMDRRIENILIYMAKQDVMERAEQFERECLVHKINPQGVNVAPRYTPDVAQDKPLQNLESLSLGELKVFASSMVDKLTVLDKAENRIAEEVKVIDQVMTHIDAGWKERQKVQAANFVLNIANAFDPYDPSMIGPQGTLIQITPSKVKALEEAYKIPSPIEILRINPEQDLDADRMMVRGDFVRELKAKLALFRNSSEVEEEFNPKKHFFDIVKEVQRNNIKINIPGPKPENKAKDKEDCEKGLLCHSMKKKKDVEAKEVKEEKSVCEKSLEKAKQLIRHAEMLLPPKPEDKQKGE